MTVAGTQNAGDSGHQIALAGGDRDDAGEPADGDRRPADLADEAGGEDEEAAGAGIARRCDQADGGDSENRPAASARPWSQKPRK